MSFCESGICKILSSLLFVKHSCSGIGKLKKTTTFFFILALRLCTYIITLYYCFARVDYRAQIQLRPVITDAWMDSIHFNFRIALNWFVQKTFVFRRMSNCHFSNNPLRVGNEIDRERKHRTFGRFDLKIFLRSPSHSSCMNLMRIHKS